MFIRFNRPIHHWNYFLSIEAELIKTSKFVEFHLDNKKTFSIEFTKIILAACSEVDVLLKEISALCGLTKTRPNFKDYFKIVDSHLPTLISEKLLIEQYGIEVHPFEEWTKDIELDWHKTYNNLKHSRGDHFKTGNFEHALLSVGALFTTVVHYYKCQTSKNNSNVKVRISDVITSILPKANLFKYSDSLHHHAVLNK